MIATRVKKGTETLPRHINRSPVKATSTSAGGKIQDSSPPPIILEIKDLPGPLSLQMLVRVGIVTELDPSSCYLREQAQGIFGRASIVLSMLPYGVAACGSLAQWIWMNGTFPDALDIISNSHFRSLVHGRVLRPHNRRLNPEYLMRLGKLWVTSPLWTACDLACEDTVLCNGEDRLGVIQDLIERYKVSYADCLSLLGANPRWPGHARGMKIITSLKALI